MNKVSLSDFFLLLLYILELCQIRIHIFKSFKKFEFINVSFLGTVVIFFSIKNFKSLIKYKQTQTFANF